MASTDLIISIIAADSATAVLRNVGRTISRMADDIIDAVAVNDRISRSITAMMAREIMQQGVVTKSIQIGTAQVQTNKSVAESTFSAAKLEAYRATQAEKLETALARLPQVTANIAKAEADLGNMRKSKTETDAQYIARHDQLIARIGVLKESLGDLNKVVADSKTPTPEYKTVAVYKTLTEQTIDMATAQKLARERTQELIVWMERLAIQSPFTKQDISDSFRFALAYSFTTAEAKSLTEATINYASAAGLSGPVMDRITVALGQIKQKGHVVGQEMRQLAEAGIPMRDMLLESGKVAGLTAANFDEMQRDGLIPAKAAMEAYVDYVNKYFGTAARDQASSFTGILTSLYDIRRIAETDLFTPIFAAVQPYLFNFVNMLQDPGFRNNVKQLGADAAAGVTATIQAIERIVAAAQTGGAKGMFTAMGFSGADSDALISIGSTIGSTVDRVVAWFNDPRTQAALDKFKTDILTGIAITLRWLAVNLPIIIDGIAKFIDDVVAWFNDPQVQAAINEFVTGVSTLVNDIVVWFNDPRTQAALDRFFTGLGRTIQDIWAWLVVAVPKVVAVIGSIVNGIVEFFSRPEVQSAIEGFVSDVLGAIGSAVQWLEQNGPGIIATVGQVLSDVGTWLVNEFWPAFISVVTWLVTNVVPAFQDIARWINFVVSTSFVWLVNAIGWVITAFSDVYMWLSTNIPIALAWVSGAFEWLGKAVQDVGGFFSGIFNEGVRIAATSVEFFRSILEPIWTWIETHLLPVSLALYNYFKTYIEVAFMNLAFIWDQYLRPVFDAIGIFFTVTIQFAIAAFNTSWEMWGQIFARVVNWIDLNIMPVLRAIGTFFEVPFKKSIEIATGVFENTLLPILKEIWKFIENSWKKSWEGIVAAFSEGGVLNKALKYTVENPLENLKKGLKFIEDLLKNVAGAIDWMTAALGKMKLPEFMQRNSPSELEMTLMGAATHLGAIKNIGMPRFGDIGYSMSNIGGASGGASGDSRRGGVTIGSVNVGRLDDGLDVFQTARAFGIEAQRRFG